MAGLERSLTQVVGDKTAKALEKAFGFTTVGDLLEHYPRRYVVRGELSDIAALKDGEEATVLAKIAEVNHRRVGGKSILEVIVTDGSQQLSLTFFNQVWRERELKVGSTGMFAGKVGFFKGKRQFAHPDYQLVPDGNDADDAAEKFAGKFLPVYGATSKLPSWKIEKCVEIALASLDPLDEFLPEQLLKDLNYPTFDEAIREIHQPSSLEGAARARERLTFVEALTLQLLLQRRKHEQEILSAHSRSKREGGLVDQFEKQLPFTFTTGQNEVNSEIAEDMAKPHPMHRLLQGEVGSGKTIVALRAMLIAVDSGSQSILLAPTEVLAQQHYRSITKVLGPIAEGGMLGGSSDGTQVVLLTGSMSAAAKREAIALIEGGEAGIIIGTHALFYGDIRFKEIGLVVVDEQHRFGVEQRDYLRSVTGTPAHLLVMTATPIPRSVAMTIFGDLEVSTLRELPAGRTPIVTHLVPLAEKPHYINRAWERIREEVAAGHQAYVVASRINAHESELDALTDEEKELAKLLAGEEAAGGEISKHPLVSVDELAPELALGPLKGLRVAPLHGKQSAELKDQTMRAFAQGEIDVLVSTTVIEVGVDVPNASMMVIMDADRFGVSQLHQLRGRVGRGGVPGLCLLVTQAEEGSSAIERLRAVEGTLDGFELSRIDLEMRSEGDVLGTLQSGSRSHLKLLRVVRDEELIARARDIAAAMISNDPELAQTPQLASIIREMEASSAGSYVEKG